MKTIIIDKNHKLVDNKTGDYNFICSKEGNCGFVPAMMARRVKSNKIYKCRCKESAVCKIAVFMDEKKEVVGFIEGYRSKKYPNYLEIKLTEKIVRSFVSNEMERKIINKMDKLLNKIKL